MRSLEERVIRNRQRVSCPRSLTHSAWRELLQRCVIHRFVRLLRAAGRISRAVIAWAETNGFNCHGHSCDNEKLMPGLLILDTNVPIRSFFRVNSVGMIVLSWRVQVECFTLIILQVTGAKQCFVVVESSRFDRSYNRARSRWSDH